MLKPKDGFLLDLDHQAPLPFHRIFTIYVRMKLFDLIALRRNTACCPATEGQCYTGRVVTDKA